MKNYPVLVLLLIACILFISCDKNEVDDYELPIRSQLPLYSYAIDSLKFKGKEDAFKVLTTTDPFIIQSEDDLQAFFDKVDDFFGDNARATLSEYTSFDFSKHTVILRFFFNRYHPDSYIKITSRFFSKDYLSDQYKSEGYSYYYSDLFSFKAHVLDDDNLFLSLSGIVVDKIPDGKKIVTAVGFYVTDGWDD